MNGNNSRRNWHVYFAMRLLEIPCQIPMGTYGNANLERILRLFYDKLGEEKFWQLTLQQFRENEKAGGWTNVKVPNRYFPFFSKLFSASMENALKEEVMHERPAESAKA